jgi:lysyl-tRNA synthetase class 2
MVLRRLSLAPAATLVAVAVTGVLYLARPAVPGPRVGMALPLDELARHSSAPLAWFVLVWVVGAVLLGGLARWARLERAAAAVGLGLAVGLWLLLADAASILVTRQIPARAAFDAASRLEAVYLPAAIVAVAAALIAGSHARGRRAPLIVSFLVAVGAFLDLLVAVLPGHDVSLLRSFAPDGAGPLARAAHVPIAVALLLAARGLARRRRRAWRLAAALAGASVALHVLHGFNQGTLVSVTILCALLARRHDFDRPGDVQDRGRALARLLVAVVGIPLYAGGALWLNRLAGDQPLSPGFAARETLHGVVGLYLGGSPHLGGFFGDWFPVSLFLLALGATFWVVGAWLAPWRYLGTQDARERSLAQELVRSFGVDTLAPFALRADKSYFFDEQERAFLAYRVVGHVAVVAGDPIGEPAAFDALLARFVAFAHERDWRLAILGASRARLGLYRAHGLHALYHGDEAVVDTASFTLDGRAIRKVRQSVHRLEQAGYRAEMLRADALGVGLRAQLPAVADAWRGEQPERGFTMALDCLFALDDAVFVVGFGPDGAAAGFLHFAVSRAGAALSLSSMPRLRSTPNGFNEWLICVAVEWARDEGFERVSLNFAPFAALLAPEAERSGLQELERRALLALKGSRFQLDSLLLFNRKFFPRWERRYVVYEHRLDLPRVGLAALAAEAYLPFRR